MAADVARNFTNRAAAARPEETVQRLALAGCPQVIIRQCRTLAGRASKLGDDGTNDMVVSDVLRTNELQTWFISEHLVKCSLSLNLQANKGFFP